MPAVWVPTETDDDPTTTIAAPGVSIGDDEVTVTDTASMPPVGYVGWAVIDDEVITVTGAADNPYPIDRAQAGTNEADHAAGADFNWTIVPATVIALMVEQVLATELGGAPAVHGHIQDDIVGLVAALALKAADSAVMHNTGTENEAGAKTRSGKQFFTATGSAPGSGRTIIFGNSGSIAGIGRSSGGDLALRFDVAGLNRAVLTADQFALVGVELAALAGFALAPEALGVDPWIYQNTPPIRRITNDSVGNTYTLPTELVSTGSVMRRGFFLIVDSESILAPASAATISCGDGNLWGMVYGSLNGVYGGSVVLDSPGGIWLAIMDGNLAGDDSGASGMLQGYNWTIFKIGEVAV